MKHILAFSNPVFHAGDNITCRAGRKWLEGCKPGDTVAVTRTGSPDILFEAPVTAVWFAPLSWVPASVLAREHDPDCRTHAGLAAELARHYPLPASGEFEIAIVAFDVPAQAAAPGVTA